MIAWRNSHANFPRCALDTSSKSHNNTRTFVGTNDLMHDNCKRTMPPSNCTSQPRANEWKLIDCVWCARALPWCCFAGLPGRRSAYGTILCSTRATHRGKQKILYNFARRSLQSLITSVEVVATVFFFSSLSFVAHSLSSPGTTITWRKQSLHISHGVSS